MAWTFPKFLKIAPGVALNISKRGVEFSVGRQRTLFRVGVGPSSKSKPRHELVRPSRSEISNAGKSVKIAPGLKVNLSGIGTGTSVGRPRVRFRVGSGTGLSTGNSERSRNSGSAARASSNGGKSYKIAPGVKVNVSTVGLGMSVGGKHTRFRIGVSSTGRIYAIGGTPQTGLQSTPVGGASARFAPAFASGVSGSSEAKISAFAICSLTIGIALTAVVVPFSVTYGVALFVLSAVPFLILQFGSARKASQLVLEANERTDSGDYVGALPKLVAANRTSSTPAIRLLLARAYIGAEEPTQAVEILSEFVADSYDDEAAILLATAYYQDGQFDNVISVAQSIEQDSRWWLRAISLQGSALAEQGKHNLVVEALETAPLRKRQLDDDLKLIHYNLAESYAATGNRTKARQHYQRVVSQDVNYLDVRKKLQRVAD